ncbi:MAG: PorV/PorQ family protein [Candidatus Krumholzibacteriia bacterium]
MLQRHHPSLRILPALLGLAVLLAAPVAPAAEPDEGVAGDWLTRFAGARTVGMGGAFVAVADDATGPLWNPAGLRWLDQNEVQFGSVRMFEDTAVNGLSFAVPVSGGSTVGFTFLTLGSGEFERTSELNEPLGDFSENDYAFLLSVARAVGERLALGVNLKVVHHGIEEYSATGAGTDLGAQFRLTDALTVGACALNLGGPTLTLRERDEEFPTELRGGVAWHLLHGAALISTEAVQRDGPGMLARAGAEVWLQHRLALRVGYYDENVAGGFGYRFADAWQFDYGASDHELGVVHRFGLAYRFGGYHASSRATPEIFSPTGRRPVTRFELAARTKAEASEWRLEIVDRSDQDVRVFGGRGAPPAQVVWDGKDATGLPLSDGLYRYRLTVRDALGRQLTSPQGVVEINTSGPDISVPVEVH